MVGLLQFSHYHLTIIRRMKVSASYSKSYHCYLILSTQSSNNIDTHSQNSAIKKERQHAVKKHEIPRRTRSDPHICNAGKSCEFQRRNIKNICSEVRRRPENPNPAPGSSCRAVCSAFGSSCGHTAW